MDDTTILAERAARFHELILDAAMGPGGMIIDYLWYDTRRPFQEGEALHWYLEQYTTEVWGTDAPRPTMAELWYGENTMWVTGWLLYSQILRYRVTNDPEALATARKCFRDLNHIFSLCHAIEPGLLGKPHGGRAGATTSYDQSACPVLFYMMYAQELATPDEKAQATANLALHGEYYLRRNWVMNHFGNLQRIVDPSHTSAMKYFACVHAAYELTGETMYRDASFKYLRQLIETGKLPWPSNPYETNHNLYYWSLLCEYWNRTEIADAFDWIGCIRTYWQAAQTTFDADGIVRFGHYDTVRGLFTPYSDRWLTHADAEAFPMQAPGNMEKRWISATSLPGRSGYCALIAALALLAQSHGLDDNANEAAKTMLLRLDEDSLRWWWDDGKLPAELQPVTNIFVPEVAAAWLVAYWMGRAQDAW